MSTLLYQCCSAWISFVNISHHQWIGCNNPNFLAYELDSQYDFFIIIDFSRNCLCKYIHTSVCMCVCVCLYICVCMCVCMCVKQHVWYVPLLYRYATLDRPSHSPLTPSSTLSSPIDACFCPLCCARRDTSFVMWCNIKTNRDRGQSSCSSRIIWCGGELGSSFFI